MSSWEENEAQAGADAVDYSRWVWRGVVAVFMLMLLALWYFRDDSAHFSQVQVRHILIPVKSMDPAERQRAVELAQAVRQQVLDGGDFDALARQYSGDPGSASRGGYLGWSKRGAYTPDFEEYIWNADIGAVSDLILTEHGFHIIQVLDRQLSAADEYDAKIDREAWEQHRREEEERRKAGQAPASALPDAPGTTGISPKLDTTPTHEAPAQEPAAAP
jgi:parvulin-like peptidyl-prolyl isomerase